MYSVCWFKWSSS